MNTIKKLQGERLRSEAIEGGYEVEQSFDSDGIRGFLIIDDVYETGATLKEVCRILQRRFPAIPRYVLTITQVKPVEVWKSNK